MKFRPDRSGTPLSILGYGCMRFPQKLGRIDMSETESQILRAIDSGVNYFDTAYLYPGSESALGEILARNGLRDTVYIATKLPHQLIRSAVAFDRIFDEQLKRLRTDHVDYYLMHMLTDTATWDRLREMGIEEWIERKKASGAIRQIGFSYHGTLQCSARCLTLMTGISVRSNITTWTNIRRPDGEGFTTQQAKGSLW